MTNFIWLLWCIGSVGADPAPVEQEERDHSPIHQTLFEDRTTPAGLDWQGEKTFSVAWVDFDNDGYEDLYIQSHQNSNTRLLLNQGDGSFLDSLSTIRPEGVDSDTHGTAWADFDNDGDPDLAIATGAYSGRGERGLPNILLRNDDGRLIEVAEELGVDYPLARGRSPFWFDQNGDGLLDLIFLNEPRADGRAPNVFFRQDPDLGFIDLTEEFGLVSGSTRGFAQIASLNPEEPAQLVIYGGVEPEENVIHDGTGNGLTYAGPSPFRLHRYGFVQDVAIGDYNRDGTPDLFMPRAPAEMDTYERMLIVSNDGLRGILNLIPRYGTNGVAEQRARTDGPLTIDLASKRPERWANEVFIGSQRIQPDTIPFVLDRNDPDVRGVVEPEDTDVAAFYVGLDESGEWVFRMTGHSVAAKAIVLRSETPITGGVWAEETNMLYTLRLDEGPSRWVSPTRDILLLSSAEGYIDSAESHGVAIPTYCSSTVTADFDNDMDLDLFLACGLRTANLENLLYLNQGDGYFRRVYEAGGATAGLTGPQFFEFGFGQRVAFADYDNDGFVDLYVGSTHLATESVSHVATPPRLYHNIGNENHWLQIVLEGTQSNRDGIGARVSVETQDGTVQFREQDGGSHHWGQNSRRLHFGLGPNDRPVRVTIHWPSGEVQTLRRVRTDRIVRITEPERG